MEFLSASQQVTSKMFDVNVFGVQRVMRAVLPFATTREELSHSAHQVVSVELPLHSWLLTQLQNTLWSLWRKVIVQSFQDLELNHA